MGRYAGWIALLCRRRRRRRRHPDSRDSVRPRERRRAAARARPLGRAVQHRRRRRRRVSRRAASWRSLEEARDGHVERLGGIGAQVCEALGDADRQGDALGGARPPAARRRADQLRSRAGDAFRRQGRRAGSAAASSARWSRSLRRTSSRGRSRTSSGGPRPCRWIRPAADGEGARRDVRRLTSAIRSRYFSAPPVLNSTTDSSA